MTLNYMVWYITSIMLVIAFSATIPLNSLLHVPASLLVLLVAFETNHVLTYLGTLLLLLIQERYIKSGKYKPYILMFTNFIILLTFKHYVEDRLMDISGPLMILTQRSFYLGHYRFASFRKKVQFLFFVPSILAGPVIHPNYKQEKRNMRRGIQMLYRSMIFGVVYLCFKDTDLKQVNEARWFLRIPYLYFYGLVRRCMYYFIWTVMYACFLMQGYNTPCIYPFSVETASTIKGLTDSWNIYTNLWLKQSIFVPLKKYGFFWASLATFLTSALWHGLNRCYFIMFIVISVSTPLLKSMDKMFSGVYWTYIARIQLGLFFAFFGYPFYSLSLEDTVEVWKSVWYYGFVLFGFMVVVHCITIIRGNKNINQTKVVPKNIESISLSNNAPEVLN